MRTWLRLCPTAGLAPLALAAGFVACDFIGPAVQGSGVVTTERRDVAPFQRIEVDGAVDVVARAGAAPSLAVTGDDNLLPFVQTEVRDGTLHIDIERSYRSRRGLRVTLATPELESVSVGGSSEVQVTDVRGPSFALSVSGSSEVTAKGEVGRLDVSVSGSGSIGMSGRAEHVEASVSGSGDLDLYRVRSRTARVGVSGSGSVAVYPTERLEADVSGSGEVRYGGNPRTTTRISGSGSVSKV